MLNIFPSFLDFSLIAPLLIRVVAGLIFIDLGFLKLTKEKKRWLPLFTTFMPAGEAFLWLVAVAEIAGGALLILGMFTQGAALLLGLIAFVNLYLEYRNAAFVKRDIVFHIMLFAMTISLLFSGAGFLAFDLPL